MSDPILPGGEAGLRKALPEVLVSALSDDAEQLAVALTEAVLADGLGFKGPFEEFGRIAEPLLLDALGAARRDGAQIALAQLQSDRTRLEAENERLRRLATGAVFHFFCCNDGIHRDDDCGQLVPAMADLARAVEFYSDPATNEEIAAVPVSQAVTALAQPQPEERK